MRRAFSEGPCGVLDAFGINRGKPLRRLHRLPHDGDLRRETEVNPCPARWGALRSSAAEKVNPVWLPAHIIQAKKVFRIRVLLEISAQQPGTREVG